MSKELTLTKKIDALSPKGLGFEFFNGLTLVFDGEELILCLDKSKASEIYPCKFIPYHFLPFPSSKCL